MVERRKVLIVEDDLIIALHLRKILTDKGYIVTDIADSIALAKKSLGKNKPDVVLLDIVLEGEEEIYKICPIITKRYKIPFVFITSHIDKETMEEARKTNPSGYVTKPFTTEQLMATVEMAIYNFGKPDANVFLEYSIAVINKNIASPLTQREYEIMLAIFEGKTNSEIAEALFISFNTVKTHIVNLYFKLDVSSRTAALAKVRQLF